MQNGKYGFINTNGEMTISCKYDDASNFREGLAVVKLDGKYGYVNKQGIDTFSKQNKATTSTENTEYEQEEQEETQNIISTINNLIKDKATFKGYGTNGYLIFSPRNERGGRARIAITHNSQYDYTYDIKEDGRILLHDGVWKGGRGNSESADNMELTLDDNQQSFSFYYGGEKCYYKLTDTMLDDFFYNF